jgi:putative DNA primase/helicase
MSEKNAAGGLAPAPATVSREITNILTSCQRTGDFRRSCPACDRGPDDKALAITVESGGHAVWFCHRCHLRGAVGSSQRRPAPPPAASRPRHQTLSYEGWELWRSCRPISGEAGAYLEARRCVVPPSDGDLRWLPRLRHPCGHIGPALVGLITDAVVGGPISLHRTWIMADGRKANIERPRLLLARHRKSGGVIRLYPGDAVTHGLAVTEGVETGLAAAHGFTPVWSCIDAGNLSGLPVLPAIDELTIFADHDDAGLTAATTLARRWADAGCAVVIATSAREGCDMADEVRA